MQPVSFKRHQFPPDVIRLAVWLYFRFTLSFRDVEEMLDLLPRFSAGRGPRKARVHQPSTRGFSTQRRGRFGAGKPKTEDEFPRERPNRPARPSPYRTEPLKFRPNSRGPDPVQRLAGIATERLPNCAPNETLGAIGARLAADSRNRRGDVDRRVSVAGRGLRLPRRRQFGPDAISAEHSSCVMGQGGGDLTATRRRETTAAGS